MFVAVISSTGQRLMPTSAYKARRLLKKGRAVIERYKPIFTIRLTDRETGATQPIEFASDTGYINVGTSIKSQKHEFVHWEHDMLPDEKERHDAMWKYRRTRRNRKRYRKARFNSRSKKNKDLAPSIRHRMENQIRLFDECCKVIPITTATFEMGKFDTQLIQAIAEGKSLPEGKDYQEGSKYMYRTVRAAVFGRDHYTCQICGKSIADGVTLHTHHIGFWQHYRFNRIGNLLTVCNECHTSANHQPGGALRELKPKGSDLAAAAYMNTVRWKMRDILMQMHPEVEIHIQYGVKTSNTRDELHIKKSHANDAYCIGQFHPKHRCREEVFQKKRRVERGMTKFYDAMYIDIRDREEKSAKTLSCGRIKRKESRRTEKNQRIYHGTKTSKGRRAIQKQHYHIRPGDRVEYQGKIRVVKGNHNGTNIEFVPDGIKPRSASPKKLKLLTMKGGWGVSSRQ